MLSRFRNDMKKYFRFSLISARSQLRAEVANSYLNWIWWVLDPLCFMLIYTFIFGYVFGAKEPYFPLFIFIGITMWDFFSKTLTGSVKIIKNNRSIVAKVYLPKYILILVKIWVNGFKMFVSFGVILLMMFIYRVPFSLCLLGIFPIILTLGIFTFGCAVHLMHFGVFVEDLSNVVAIVLRFVFYLTGIFYNVEKRIPKWGGILNTYNPLACLITDMRNCMIYQASPKSEMLLFWLVIGLVISALGIRKIYREENSYVSIGVQGVQTRLKRNVRFESK